jgi:hypothetical protein
VKRSRDDDDDPEVLIATLPQSSQSTQIRVTVGGTRLPRSQDTVNTTLPLHEMPALATIDKLIEWSASLRTFMETLDAMEILPAQMTQLPPVSRHFAEFDIDRIAEITEPCDPATRGEDETLRARKIPKSNGTARLIVDGRPANSRCVNAPRPEMPDLQRMFRHEEASWGWTADLKGWFFQLPLPRRLRHLFTLRVAAVRGRFVVRRMTRLPMGASFAPAYAQYAAEAIIAEVRRRLENHQVQMFVWLDNVCTTGPTKEEADRAKQIFVTVCEEARVTIKEISDTMTKLDVLGLTWELTTRTLGPNEALTAKLTAASTESAATCREFMSAAGLLFFPNYMFGRLPLAAFPTFFADIQDASTAARMNGWNATFRARGGDEFAAMRDDLLRHRRLPDPRPQPAVFVWSDASTHAMAWIRQEGLKDTQARVAHVTGVHEDMYYREMEAAIAGSLATQAPHMVVCDNRAALLALRKGHSSTRKGNRLLRHWCATTACTHVAWVHTARQRADELSRGVATTRPPWRPVGDELQWCWTALPVERGGGPTPDTSSSSKVQPTLEGKNASEREKGDTLWIPVIVENDEVMTVTSCESLPEPIN